MKKILGFLMAAAVLFGASSCVKEDISSSLAGGEVEVTLTIDVPELATRADGLYGDGMKVNQLFVAVYEQGGTKALATSHLDGSDEIKNGKAYVTMVLLTDKTYDLVFWAQVANAGAFTLNLANGRNIVANYDCACNLEDRDAFFLIKNDWKAGRDKTNFSLQRPFAQINVANSDEDKVNVTNNGATIKTSKMTVASTTPVYTTLNLSDGSVSGEYDPEFAAANIPDQHPFHIAGYNYLAMNYLLVNVKQNVDLEFVFADQANTLYTRKYYNVPVQRNYRTNILGNILSSEYDFTVEIDPIFEGVHEVDAKTQIFDVATDAELLEALTTKVDGNIEHIVINLNADVTLDVAPRLAKAIGGEYTKDITINGAVTRSEKYTLTFNNTDSDWNNIATKGAKLILKNLNITNSGHDATSGTWNAHDLYFVCDVEMDNVTSLNAIALGANATIKNSTINDDSTSDSYALWIVPNGQTVNIEDCTIDSTGARDGRGIKIDNQYVDNAAKVVLNIANTQFVTEEKSAIIVNTPAGAEINLDNVNITKVAADTVNAVWVDEDAAEYVDLVTVTGGKMTIEGYFSSVAADLKSGNDVTLVADVTGTASNSSYGKAGLIVNGQTIDGNGNTLTVNDAWDTWDCAIEAKGGTIKNLTVSSAFRGIFMSGANSDLYIDNVVFDNVVYTFNSDAGNKNYGVYISNSTLNGWTSHSDVHKEVVYTNCSFGKGNGNAFCRPYGPTTFVRCNFCEGFEIDAVGNIVLVDCTVGGVDVTAENIATLVTSNTANASLAPVVASTEALTEALASTTYVKVAAGQYTFPSSSVKAGVIIECAKGTVFTGNSKLNINGATVIGAKFSNPTGTAVDQTINGTFKNCTFEGSNALRWCYAGETVVFENCVFSGSTYGIHFDGGAKKAIFRGCTISGFNAFASDMMVTFEGCTFEGNGKSGYNGANLWGSAKMVNCEFTFNGTTAYEWIDCIGADKTYSFENCTINGVDYTAENYAEYLANIESRNDITVKINGVDCAM